MTEAHEHEGAEPGKDAPSAGTVDEHVEIDAALDGIEAALDDVAAALARMG